METISLPKKSKTSKQKESDSKKKRKPSNTKKFKPPLKTFRHFPGLGKDMIKEMKGMEESCLGISEEEAETVKTPTLEANNCPADGDLELIATDVQIDDDLSLNTEVIDSPENKDQDQSTVKSEVQNRPSRTIHRPANVNRRRCGTCGPCLKPKCGKCRGDPVIKTPLTDTRDVEMEPTVSESEREFVCKCGVCLTDMDKLLPGEPLNCCWDIRQSIPGADECVTKAKFICEKLLDKNVLEVMLRVRALRYSSYRAFYHLVYKKGKKNVTSYRQVLPSCFVALVRTIYPEEEGQSYKGYKAMGDSDSD